MDAFARVAASHLKPMSREAADILELLPREIVPRMSLHLANVSTTLLIQSFCATHNSLFGLAWLEPASTVRMTVVCVENLISGKT